MWFLSNFFGFLIISLVLCTGIIIMLYLEKFKVLLYQFNIKWLYRSMKILEITNEEQSENACQLIRSHCEDLNALGFDCEWVIVSGKQRPVALLQLATVHGLCCLFRLNILCKIPNELENLLLDSHIIKLGISPLNDAKLLKKDYKIQVCSTLDLRHLYPKSRGLASMAASEIGVKLNKSVMVKCSNWENLELTESQKDYAAKDAFTAIAIFKKWLLTKNNLPNLYRNKISNYNHLFSKELKSEISRYLDVHFKPKKLSKHLEQSKKEKILTEDINNQNQKKKNFAARKSLLYHNCFMHAPDGALLCSCHKRKAQWYVDRSLAEVLPGEPYSIKLLFEPAARTSETDEGRFYQQIKQNCCVVCGALESFLKHNVVPKEYRKHFPNALKDHQSHDIVLMCTRCHYLAAQHNENLKQKLSELCDAPLKVPKVTHVRAVQKVKNSAKALLNAGDAIPFEKRTILEEEVKQYFKTDTLNSSLLNVAANLETKLINEDYISHGLKVVNYFKQQDDGLKKLEILWRKHFLDTMEPQHLPFLWSVNHNSKLTETLTEQL